MQTFEERIFFLAHPMQNENVKSHRKTSMSAEEKDGNFRCNRSGIEIDFSRTSLGELNGDDDDVRRHKRGLLKGFHAWQPTVHNNNIAQV
jgi:hypothetical protein